MAYSASFDAMADWEKSMMRKLVKKQRYPRSAIQRGIEGIAKIRIIIDKDGNITEHEIVQSTGEKVLDREIDKLIKSITPLDPLPDGKEKLAIVVPVAWQLS